MSVTTVAVPVARAGGPAGPAKPSRRTFTVDRKLDLMAEYDAGGGATADEAHTGVVSRVSHPGCG